MEKRDFFTGIEQNKQIIQDIHDEIAKIFNWMRYFSLIYGSYPNWSANSQSDLDIVVGVPTFKEKLFNYLKDYIIELHKTNNLWIDNEVPYENKLLIPYDEFYKSSKLKWLKFKNDSISVPEIEKTSMFLASQDIKYRLIFNILTVPTIYSWNDSMNYSSLKNEAEDNLIMLALDLSDKTELKEEDLLRSLLLSKDGRKEWELFLWYKNITIVIEYLKSIIRNKLKEFDLIWLVKIYWDKIYPDLAKIKSILDKNINSL